MSNPTEKGVCDNHFSNKKGVCDQFGVYIYCDAPPYFQSKMNHKHFGIQIQSGIEQEKKKIEQKNNLPWKR